MKSGAASRTDPFKVFFDGACPLCEREIRFYRRQCGGERIDWVDLRRTAGNSLPIGLEKSAALRRFHVQTGDGRIVSGADAFALLWRELPAFRWAGRVAGWWPSNLVLAGAYRVFLKLRPRLQALAGKL